jgi:hypothetical protein
LYLSGELVLKLMAADRGWAGELLSTVSPSVDGLEWRFAVRLAV